MSNLSRRLALAIEPLEQRRLMDADALVGLDLFRADPRFAGIDGSGYSVVVIDHGADMDHPFFGADLDQNGIADRIVFQRDFGDNDSDANDTNGHGTNVAGVIGSEDAAHPGVAPGVNLIVLKLFKTVGDTDVNDLEAPLQWIEAHAEEYNIVAVNLSITDSMNHVQSHTNLKTSDEFARLAGMGVIVVAAAGNSFQSHGSEAGVGYPAADPNVIAVSGVWADNYGLQNFFGGENTVTAPDHVAAFSQRHPTLTDVFAPAGYVITAEVGGASGPHRGTSFAAPFVAGAAALAQQLAERELGRRLSVEEFRDLVISTGVIIHDGDDEIDNVANTDADYRRLNILALGESLLVNPGPPTLSILDVTVGESDDGTTMAEVVVQISREPTETVTVDYATGDGVATLADGDYIETLGQLTFSPGGPLVQSIFVPIVGDTQHEPAESFHVVLSNATNATVPSPQATVTIQESDLPRPWRNPTNPLDVNGNGFVTGLDALVIINKLNTTGPEVLPASPPPGPYFFYDVSGDGRVTAMDALLVINHLNAVLAGAGTEVSPAGDTGVADAGEPATDGRSISGSQAPLVNRPIRSSAAANDRAFGDVAWRFGEAELRGSAFPGRAWERGERAWERSTQRTSVAARAAWQFFWAEYESDRAAREAFDPRRPRR